MSPAEFAADTVAVSPMVARQAVDVMVKRLGNPPMSVEKVLTLLVDRYEMSDAVALLREV
ncbi:hypothetical protein [Rhodococcus sp. DMU1]|uniref:hypothetical protein n=1 Tax=Rhodococcus sp. DMU1 TaxID=2722825 RepID=UPI001B2FF158|nr:hypothetical protein [Rhodococcus sp. DMU1]